MSTVYVLPHFYLLLDSIKTALFISVNEFVGCMWNMLINHIDDNIFIVYSRIYLVTFL